MTAATPNKEGPPSPPLELRWVWTLANGGTVTAIIDSEANTEVVSQDDEVLSKSTRGGKPDGHAILVNPRRDEHQSERPPMQAVVSFGIGTAVCILRVDGEEVAPQVWPQRKRREPALVEGRKVELPLPRSRSTYVLIAACGIALIVAGVAVKLLKKAPEVSSRADGKLTGTYRALNGLFIAHYSEDLEPKLPIMPAAVGAVQLDDKLRTMSILIGGVTLAEGAVGSPGAPARDPWVLQQLYHDEALANLPKGSGKYEETSRQDDLCIPGKPGAVVSGQIMAKNTTTRIARVWTCTFVHETAGYIMMTMLAEPVGSVDEKHARSILEATELTKLSDLGGIPPGLIQPGASASVNPELGNIPTIGSGSLPKIDLNAPIK